MHVFGEFGRFGVFTVVVLAMVTGSSSVAQARLLLHAHDSRANLYTVDVTTGSCDLIGNTGFVLSDIAFDSDGRLFGVSLDGWLYEVNPLTAATTRIGRTGASNPNALVFDQDGVLWMAGDQSVRTVDPATAASTVVGEDVAGWGSAGDLALDFAGNMYLTTDNGMLITVDRKDGTVPEVGSLPYRYVYGLARARDGVMYGITSSNQILHVDTSTGAATLLRNIDASFSIGDTYGTSFTDETIPEPATVLFLGIGGLGLMGRRRSL